MREWIQRAMAGRYGVDQLNRFLTIFAMVMLILSMFFQSALSLVFWLLAIVSLVWSYARMFSRKIPKRQAENNAYLTLRY